jgi:hypothetical protein
MPKVLIAEDDLMIADSVAETLVESGIARTVAEAVELGRLHKPDFARWSASRSTVCRPPSRREMRTECPRPAAPDPSRPLRVKGLTSA